MRREELIMEILGGLDESFLIEAMPCMQNDPVTGAETNTGVMKKRSYHKKIFLGIFPAAAAIIAIAGAIILRAGITDDSIKADTSGVSETAVTNVSKIVTDESVTAVSSAEPEDNTRTATAEPADTASGQTVTSAPDDDIVRIDTNNTSILSKPTDITCTTDAAAPETSSGQTFVSDDTPVIDSAEVSIITVDFDYVINNCYALVWAECGGIVSQDSDSTVYRFSCMEILSGGDMPRDFELIVPNQGYRLTDIHEGGLYAFPVEKKISVFWEKDRYYLSCGVLFVTDTKGNIEASYMQYIEPALDVSDLSELKDYIEAKELICDQKPEDTGTRYTAAGTVEEVIRESDYVVEVEITGINTDFVPDRTSYDCRVLNIYKCGDSLSDMLDITARKHSAQVGGKYIFVINRVSEGSGLFVISSYEMSVFSTESPQAQKIMEFCRENY